MQNIRVLRIMLLTWRLLSVGEDALSGVKSCTGEIRKETKSSTDIAESMHIAFRVFSNHPGCKLVFTDTVKTFGLSAGVLVGSESQMLQYGLAFLLLVKVDNDGKFKINSIGDLLSAIALAGSAFMSVGRLRDGTGKFKTK
jgi:hypothetical protein